MLKKMLMRWFLAFSVVFAVFFVSCEVADDNLPDEEIAAKIVGSWKVAEQPSGNNYTISVNSNGSVSITISNFYNVDVVVNATVSEGSLIIPTQVVGGYTFKGTGVFSNSYNTITLNYTADDGSGVENVTNRLSR